MRIFLNPVASFCSFAVLRSHATSCVPHQCSLEGTYVQKICILSVAHGDVGLREDLYEADRLRWGPVSAKAARLFADGWKALFRIRHGEALHVHAQYSILAKAHADFVESPYTEPFTNA
ncbi:hypothetical protein M514_03036 [Trichuris suis]|uniref:Uncharacterized protein n=1 Tax=Trichuris suis TaxID=68888 RepID=A0A085MFB6_9BILA|nr:hypothetical protein M513_03036 [Trichuris suis]KFD68327.1 hypothetical protein M514_03036 [Trichuris suis]